MRVLLDENLPHQLHLNLQTHEVKTAQYSGWGGMKNGELLRTAEADGVDVLVTSDQNLTYQQNLSERAIAIVVLTRQKWSTIRPHLQTIQAAFDRATPDTFQVVQCNRPPEP